MKIWGHIVDCLEGSGACALVTVAGADGSTPREAGARMVVDRNCGFYGTIGGGTLEFEAIRRAARAAEAEEPLFFVQSVSLGPDLGQCCGGRAQVAIEVLTAASLDMAKRLAGLEAKGSPLVTQAIVKNGTVLDREVLASPLQQHFSLETDAGTGDQLLLEQFGASRRHLFLFGAGHVGKALVLALAPLPFEVTWVDSRADQFPGPVPANVRKVRVSDPASILETAPDGAFVLVMTHSHALDEDIMARALLRQSFAYCGVIGSKTKRSRFQKRLKSRGLTETLISSMVCPVGTTAIKSKHPAAIAAGIAVDLLQRDEANHQQAAAGEGLAQIVPLGQ